MSVRTLLLTLSACLSASACSGEILLGDLEQRNASLPDSTPAWDAGAEGNSPWTETSQEESLAPDDTGSLEGAAEAQPPACPVLAGPLMRAVPGGYCIDSTEVTRKQYAVWLSTHPSLQGQPAACQANTSFANEDPFCAGNMSNILGLWDENPQGCVDWCDARAYCEGVGKRLCGRIGGGALEDQDFENASASQWYNACSSGGTQEYPYGTGFDASACIIGGVTDHTEEVGSAPGCQSPVANYGGVYDLSGNVAEWEDLCYAGQGANDTCAVRGGQTGAQPVSLSCGRHPSGLNAMVRSSKSATIGFRCCWP